jgi:hypothetical protein
MTERNITRTIKSTIFEIIGLDLHTMQPRTITTVRTGSNIDPLRVIDETRRGMVGDFAPAVITKQTETENLYSMPETLFLKYAMKVDRPTGTPASVSAAD